MKFVTGLFRRTSPKNLPSLTPEELKAFNPTEFSLKPEIKIFFTWQRSEINENSAEKVIIIKLPAPKKLIQLNSEYMNQELLESTEEVEKAAAAKQAAELTLKNVNTAKKAAAAAAAAKKTTKKEAAAAPKKAEAAREAAAAAREAAAELTKIVNKAIT